MASLEEFYIIARVMVGGHVSAGRKNIWEPRGYVRAEFKRDTVIFCGVATEKF